MVRACLAIARSLVFVPNSLKSDRFVLEFSISIFSPQCISSEKQQNFSQRSDKSSKIRDLLLLNRKLLHFS